MDDSKDLLPQYLRFVRGIIDSEDLPLNVSREILQQNRVLTSIRTASVKKILSELKNIATNQPEKYLEFITEYNRPLKEGLYNDYANRETLLDLVRFKSTKVEGLTSLRRRKVAHEGRTRRASTTSPAASESLLRTSRHCLRSTKRRTSKSSSSTMIIDEIVFSGVDKYGRPGHSSPSTKPLPAKTSKTMPSPRPTRRRLKRFSLFSTSSRPRSVIA